MNLELAKALGECSQKWDAMLGHGSNPIDFENKLTFALYLETLEEVRVTADELRHASKMILSSQEWVPRPAVVIKFVQELRAYLANENRKRELIHNELVLALDASGNEVACCRQWVHDGRVMPHGRVGCNGIPFRPLDALPIRDTAALPMTAEAARRFKEMTGRTWPGTVSE